MRFVIIGAGRVGRRTAGVLVESGHDVVVIENDPATASDARADGLDIVDGDGTVEQTLELAHLDATDAVGALTSDLNDNFVICMIAKEYGCRTVMRIDEDYRERIYRQYADDVDEVVHPERLGAIAAKNALLGGNSRAIADIAHDLQLIEFTVTNQSPVRGYTVGELELPTNAELLAFGVDDGPMGLPATDDTLEAGNRIVVLADFDVLSTVRQLIVGESGQQIVIEGA